ncbi:hypothetical protein BRC81_13910 [Halobacteriales archaeon QS_1_68_20]|nr:MAG: hypothetical protein BRC81_13910 [Halobacteriales archaeon QS_1_68_20]
MRLAVDDRARMAFALVGVVLLVGSATYVTTMQERGPPAGRPDAELARERLDAALDVEVRGAIQRAAEAAARNPVVDPADTPAGRVLDESTPFRDYLRIRIYHEVRETLGDLRVSTGTVSGEASLPPTPDAGALRTAKRRVEIDRGERPGTLTARIENVTTRLVREGTTVREERRTITKTVTSPVLVLHDRVETYEDRLNRGPLEGTGFGRYLAARLYSMAWIRGYLQYAGVPVRNVIATRHVEALTNSALLATQRSVFGRSDPAGRDATSDALVHAGIQDLVMIGGFQGDAWLDRVLKPGPGVPGPASSVPTPRAPSFDSPGPEANLTVGVDETADAAFADLLDDRSSPSLNATLDAVYGADVRRRAETSAVRTSPPPDPEPPAGNWTLVDETVETDTTVSNASGPIPPLADGWDRLRSYTRRVERHNTVTWTWSAENESRQRETTATWTNVTRVGIGLHAQHSPTDRVPRRGIESVYEPGGPLDGPNLADVEATAVDRLVDDRGGPDGLARRAVREELDESVVRIDGERPAGLVSWLYGDLATLRERIRAVNVSVQRGNAAVGVTNAASALAGELERRRSDLIGVPETYDSVADKARVAARAAYVDAVVQAVRDRAGRTDDRVDAVDDELGDFGFDVDAAAEIMALDPAGAERSPLYVGQEGPVEGAVTASPAYLTVESVSPDRVPAVDGEFRPLVTRNHNLLAAPYGDLASDVVDAVLGESTDTVGLEPAALALQSANRTIREADDGELAARRDDLAGEIRTSLDAAEERLVEVLGDRTDLDSTERRLAVHEALGRWDTVHTRALAIVNRSVAGDVVDEVGRRTNLTDRQVDLLNVTLRVELDSLVEDEQVRVDRGQVDEAASITRNVAANVTADLIGTEVNRTVGQLYEKWTGDHLVSVPAGLPIAPVPGFWYVTANAWNVSTRGTYARFAVGARTGTPDGATTTTYVRDGSAVELDVFGDGDPAVLGNATRVSFEATVPVVVVVPPGGRGVGDVHGPADERSGGWPDPGPTGRPAARVTTPYTLAR